MKMRDYQLAEVINYTPGPLWSGRYPWYSCHMTLDIEGKVTKIVHPYIPVPFPVRGYSSAVEVYIKLPDEQTLNRVKELCEALAAQGQPIKNWDYIKALTLKTLPPIVLFNPKEYPPTSPCEASFLRRASPKQVLAYLEAKEEPAKPSLRMAPGGSAPPSCRF